MTPTRQIITITATATVLHDAPDAQATTPGNNSQNPPPACRTLQPGGARWWCPTPACAV